MLRTFTATSEHVALMEGFKAALKRHAHLSPEVMLSVASQLVGILAMFQDQRKYSPKEITDAIMSNIETGKTTATLMRFSQGQGNA